MDHLSKVGSDDHTHTHHTHITYIKRIEKGLLLTFWGRVGQAHKHGLRELTGEG